MYFKTMAAAAGLLISFATVGHAATLYGTNYLGPDELFEIDTSTGTATAVGSTGLNGNITDLTSDTRQATATIYGVAVDGTNSLVTIDPMTGLSTVGPTITGTGGDIISLAFDETTDTLYGNTSDGFGFADTLYTIDVTTGAATFVGAIGFDDVFALSFDMSGNLFGITDIVGDFLSINTTTGVGSVLGNLGIGGWYDLAFDPDTGTMFASDTSVTSLYTIDTSNGSTILVGNYATNSDAGNIAGLAFGATVVPEPPAMPLLLAGLGCIGLVKRRRKNGGEWNRRQCSIFDYREGFASRRQSMT